VFARHRPLLGSLWQHDTARWREVSVTWTPLLWFGAIVVLIPLALWLLKRTPLGGGAGSGPVRHVAALPLSASQRVAIVEVGSGSERRWLVLGVSGQSIHTLHTMAPQDEGAPSPADPGAGFAQLLSRLKRNP
jgi:flagellar protein FliO/FliZ